MYNFYRCSYRLYKTFILVFLFSPFTYAAVDTSKFVFTYSSGTNINQNWYSSLDSALDSLDTEITNYAGDLVSTTVEVESSYTRYNFSYTSITGSSSTFRIFRRSCSLSSLSDLSLCQADEYTETCTDKAGYDAYWPEPTVPTFNSFTWCETSTMCEAVHTYSTSGGSLSVDQYYTGSVCVGELSDYDDCLLYGSLDNLNPCSTSSEDDTGFIVDSDGNISSLTLDLASIINTISGGNLALRSDLTKINENISQQTNDLVQTINNNTNSINSNLSTQTNNTISAIETNSDNIVFALNDLSTNINDTNGSISDSVSLFQDSYLDKSQILIQSLQDLNSKINESNTQNSNGFADVVNAINDQISGLETSINNLNLDSDNTDLINAINGIDEAILNSLSNATFNVSVDGTGSSSDVATIKSDIKIIKDNLDFTNADTSINFDTDAYHSDINTIAENSASDVDSILSEYAQGSDEIINSSFSTTTDVTSLLGKFDTSNGFSIDADAVCPDAEVITVLNTEYSISYQPFCDLAPLLKAVLIMFSTMAGFTVLIKHF